MAISQQLMHNAEVRLIGFTGGKGRNYLLNQIASELAHAGKKIVITHLEKDILAPSGFILYRKDENTLIKEIEREISQNPIIFAATDIQDHLMSGVSPETISKLKNLPNIDYILLLLGNEKKYSILSKPDIMKLNKLVTIDQMIYIFQLDLIDQVLDDQMVGDLEGFLKSFPREKNEKTLTQELITKYLTDDNHGTYKLFQKKWPTYLIFTDISNIFMENRCINIARDLYQKNITHIFQANLKDNMVKRISAK